MTMLNIVTKMMVRLARDEKGVSAVEYAILAGLIVVGVTAAVGGFTTELATKFTSIIP